MRFPNGYGTVYKLSGKRRRPFVAAVPVGFKPNGKVIQQVLDYYRTRQEGLAALADYNEKKKGISASADFKEFKKVQIASHYTFAQIYDLWTAQRYVDKGHKIPSCYSAAYAWCKELYSLPFTDVRQMHLQKAIDNCTKGYATKKNMKTLFNFLYKYAIGNDIVKTMYSSLIELPPLADSDIHKPFTDEEMQILWANSASISVQTVLIMAYTGMRPSEFLKIKTENIVLNDRYMKGGLKTAAGFDRIIPIAECIFPFIKAMYNPERRYLFPDESGKELSYNNYCRKFFEPAMIKLNLDHLPHDGRHTCASALDRAEVNPVIIRRILGHRAKDITEKVYIHKYIPELVEAANKQAVFS